MDLYDDTSHTTRPELSMDGNYTVYEIGPIVGALVATNRSARWLELKGSILCDFDKYTTKVGII